MPRPGPALRRSAAVGLLALTALFLAASSLSGASPAEGARPPGERPASTSACFVQEIGGCAP